MKTTIQKAMLAVMAAGCAGDPGAEEARGEPRPILEGTYAVETGLALPDGYLAGRDTLLDDFLSMTDDPHDPATWLLDRVEDRLGWIEANALSAARGALGLDAAVNAIILDRSPELVAELAQLGADTAALAGRLEVSSRLTVREADGQLVADHQVVAIAFALDGAITEVDGVPMPAPARGVRLALDPEAPVVRIDRHRLAPLEQGALLRFALERVALQRVAPGAASLTGWLADEIDCAGIGAAVEELVEVGSPSDYQAACVAVVDRAVEEVLGDALSMRAELTLGGRADLADDDGDGVIDAMTGAWQGTMTVDGQALAAPASRFEGVRE